MKELTAGAKVYFDHVNAKGGVHGRKIVLESTDDGFDPKKSPDVFKKLIEEKKVFAMFLSRGTPTNEAAYPVLEAAKVPLIGPSTGAMSMYNPPRKYMFPVRASYHSETFKIVPQLMNMGINRIALLYVDDSFGKDGLAGVQQAMKDSQARAGGGGEPRARQHQARRGGGGHRQGRPAGGDHDHARRRRRRRSSSR